MQTPDESLDVRGDRAADAPPLVLAVAALEQAPLADALLAFKEAVAAFARSPTADNAHKVELTMHAVRRHRQQAQAEAGSPPAAF